MKHMLGRERDLESVVGLGFCAMYSHESAASEQVCVAAAATDARCCELAYCLVQGWLFPS